MQNRRKTLIPLLFVAAAALLSAAACGGPPDATAGLKDATDASNARACKEGGPALPYTVGMNQTMVGQIMTAMGSGKLVAVRYTCDEFYIVPGCELEEPSLRRMQGYRFIKTPLLTETKTFKGQAEIQGNFSSITASGSGAASASMEASLETRLIGSRLTNISRVDETQLDQFGCREATHFIKKAQVGAFRLSRESQSAIAATVQVSTPGASGGGSVNTEQARRLGLEGGKWESCEESAPGNTCQVPVQLTLLPILDQPLEGDAPIAIAPPPFSPATACSGGQVFSGGRCVSKARAAELGGFACDPGNEAQCAEQCADGAGNADSCNSLGELLVARDKGKALSLFEKACGASKDPSQAACANVGELLFAQGKLAEARARFEKACEAGVGEGCYGLGLVLEQDPDAGKEDTATYDAVDAEEIPDVDETPQLPPQLEKFQLACDAGYSPGCARVGGFAMDIITSVIDLGTGEEFDEDAVQSRLEARGIDMMQAGSFFEIYFNEDDTGYLVRCIDEREAEGRDSTGCYFDKMLGDIESGCMGGSAQGCYRLGKLYETGVFATDLKPSIFRARALFQAACKDGEVAACAEEAAYFAREELLLEEPADPKRAFSLVWKACTGETLRGVAQLKRPGAQDNGLAILDPDGCAELAWLIGGEREVDVSRYADGDQDKREEFAREMLKLVCHKYKSPRGCFLLGQAYERPTLGFGRDEAEAVSGYVRACQQGRSDACYRLASKFRDGRGVIRDLDRAVTLYHRGCQLDANPRACYDLAELALRQCDIGEKEVNCFFFQRFVEEEDARRRAGDGGVLPSDTSASGQTLTPPQRFSSAIFSAYMIACQQRGYTRACLRGAEQLIGFANRKRILNLPPAYGVMTDTMLDLACRRSEYDGRIPEYSVGEQRDDARRACMVAGERYAPPGGRAGVNAEAFYRYLVACNDFDHPQACTRVAAFYQETRRDTINAERYMRRTCELEVDGRLRQMRSVDPTSSAGGGGGLFGGGGSNQNELEERKRKYEQERALVRGSLTSCNRAEEMSRAARRDQCLKSGLTNADRFETCMEAAEMLQGSNDRRAARTVDALYKQACDAERSLQEGDQMRSGACVKLEITQCNRAPGAQNVQKLLTEIDDDCTRGNLPEACAYAGEVYYRSGPPGRPGLVKRDVAKARDRLTRACRSSREGGPACTLLGDLHLESKAEAGAERAHREALRHYVRGCDKGHGLACHKIGILFNTGVKDVFIKDTRRARKRFQQACRLGHAAACAMAAPAAPTTPAVNTKRWRRRR